MLRGQQVNKLVVTKCSQGLNQGNQDENEQGEETNLRVIYFTCKICGILWQAQFLTKNE